MACGCIILIRIFVIHRLLPPFIFMCAIQTDKIYLIKDNKSNQRLSVYYTIRVVGKCVGYESIYYVINLDVILSYMVLANLIICFY